MGETDCWIMKQKNINLLSITLLSLVIGIFLFLGGIFSSISLRNILSAQQEVFVLDFAQKASKDFADYLKREMQTLDAISNIFADFYSYSSLDEYLSILDDISRHYAFRHTGIFFINSKTAYFENGEVALNFLPQNLITKGLQGENGVSNLFFDPIDKKPVILYTTPFTVNGKTEAILFATQSIETLQRRLEKYKVGGEGFTVILNKKEQVIVDTHNTSVVPGKNLKDILSLNLKEVQVFYDNLVRALNSEDEGVFNYIVKTKNERRLLSFVRISVLGFEDWHLIFVIPSKIISVLQRKIFFGSLIFCFALLISFALILIFIKRKEQKQKQEFFDIAFTDDVTGSYNMARFNIEMEKSLHKHINKNFALIMLDIDKFKLINDLYGFRQGDLVLNHVANVLNDNTNKDDGEIFCRLIGDNFLTLLSYKTDKDLSNRIDKIGKAIHNCYAITDINYTISAYFGIYKISGELPFFLMLDRANLAKKNAKASINRKYMFYDDKALKDVLWTKEIENSMQQGLKDEEFKLYFQPKCAFNQENISGAEVLVRWENHKKGIIPPDQFIPIFEHNGFIIKLDFYILEHALKNLRAWIDAGLKPCKLSINFSRLHLKEELTLPKIKILLDFYKIPAEFIEIEITESAVMNNTPEANKFIKGLHDMGISVAMDDFGSGYSSLNVLKDLPFDTLKIDKEFLRDFGNNPRTVGILEGIIKMLKNMKVFIVAEGVETQEQAQFLRSLNCDTAQGFLYYKPLNEKDFQELLQKLAIKNTPDRT